MPQVTLYRSNWKYNTDTTGRNIEHIDSVDGRLLYFRGEVSDGVYNILMNRTIEEHDIQVRKILKDN